MSQSFYLYHLYWLIEKCHSICSHSTQGNVTVVERISNSNYLDPPEVWEKSLVVVSGVWWESCCTLNDYLMCHHHNLKIHATFVSTICPAVINSVVRSSVRNFEKKKWNNKTTLVDFVCLCARESLHEPYHLRHIGLCGCYCVLCMCSILHFQCCCAVTLNS